MFISRTIPLTNLIAVIRRRTSLLLLRETFIIKDIDFNAGADDDVNDDVHDFDDIDVDVNNDVDVVVAVNNDVDVAVDVNSDVA